MANALKGLVKDTAVYGLSSILGRFLNWALTPLYTRVLVSTGEFGVQTNLYAWTALLMAILTYGMETGFFRFVNKEPNPQQVYSTTLISLGTTSSFFILLSLLFLSPISSLLGYADRSDLVAMLVFIIATDAFMAIPFAYLRYKNRPWRFATIKLTFIALSIGLNLFFFLLCPWIWRVAPEAISWFYDPEFGVGYIFVSNLISNGVIFLMLLPYILPAGWHFSSSLLRRMLAYSLPLLLLGIAGIFNQMADKILFPIILTDRAEAEAQLGIYSACFKIAMVMVMFTQAFRYAYEPFVFNKGAGDEAERRRSYALAMKYFLICSLFVFVGVMAGMDVLQYLVGADYREGLKVVPLAMWGELMMGVYFNLSLWYKLVDKTWWGALISSLGCIFTIAIICWGVPRYSYMACAWASAISNTVMAVVCYLLGQKYYKVEYELKNALFYFTIAAIAVAIVALNHRYIAPVMPSLMWVVNIAVVGAFLFIIIKKDVPLGAILQKIRR
nr:oligosaccharide flippase family protein [uncultured Porphyromonas sp.]